MSDQPESFGELQNADWALIRRGLSMLATQIENERDEAPANTPIHCLRYDELERLHQVVRIVNWTLEATVRKPAKPCPSCSGSGRAGG